MVHQIGPGSRTAGVLTACHLLVSKAILDSLVPPLSGVDGMDLRHDSHMQQYPGCLHKELTHGGQSNAPSSAAFCFLCEDCWEHFRIHSKYSSPYHFPNLRFARVSHNAVPILSLLPTSSCDGAGDPSEHWEERRTKVIKTQYSCRSSGFVFLEKPMLDVGH